MISNQNNQQNLQGYYQQPQQPQQQMDLNPQTLSNILFVADLHEDMTEEDLSLFFKDFKFRHAKLYK
jgi:hypothetical protein